MPGLSVGEVDPSLPTVTAPPSPAATSFDPAASARAELERQVRAYDELGVLSLLGTDAGALRADLEPLLPALESLPVTEPGREGDGVAFVLVLPGLHSNAVVPAMRRGARHGVSVIDDAELVTYVPLPDVEVPDAPYLLTALDTGSEHCGVTPEEALATTRARGRDALTVAEGIALTIVRPDVLRSNRCYSLALSRTGTNQRVPAIWISDRRAKLGWCWDRNPHTWLGLASAGGRLTTRP